MRWLVLALLALPFAVMAACGSDTESPSATAPGSDATQTPRATSAPVTPTPRSGPPSAEAIVERMQSMGIQIGENASYSATNDPDQLLGQPHQYTSRVNFADIRIRPLTDEYINVGDGGSIESFTTEDDARARFDAVSAADPANRSYIEGAIVMRLTGALSDDQATEYETAFRAVVQGE